MKSLEWILKNALSPINCLVGWYLLWFSSIYFLCLYFLVHFWSLTVSICNNLINEGLIRSCFATSLFPFLCVTFFKTIWSEVYHFPSIIDEYAYLILEFGVYRIFMHIMLTLAEMVIFKILYLYKFSVIAAMDEYFLTNFVTLFNLMINFGLTIVRISLGENKRTRMYFYNFAKPFEVYERVLVP